ncbi:Adhesion G protein-coupled receptor E1 [Triplophysa tibetana]|uniref:Adhesion G protein-coupled receptor E1 n=1 Tax=Triplophysa tibetana TaxID=1572043 RepID=A0A5A9PKU5_9TELE|nr:Adhesion G protein-coupled receptor E1 [Triplophysa tibetana]
MSETCVPTYRCGTDVPLWLSDGHPKPEDGVVTRDVCGHRNNYCCYYQSYPIRVKACPDNYYVYEFVTPTSHYCGAYCADVKSINAINVTSGILSTDLVSVDPCYNYTVMDDERRSTDYYSSPSMCDASVTWVGWYRLYLNGQSVDMPETCVPTHRCGTDAPLWLSDGHPKPEDGVVTRHVCGHWSDQCCNYQSYPIRVKACPDNYYVYEFVKPPYNCSAYCADLVSVDPCNNYTVMDDSRRSTNYSSSSDMCDRDVNWVGWYRLYLNGQNVRMSETCVPTSRCGTRVPLWLSDGHPKPEDGVVTRHVCGHDDSYCCYVMSYPIRVKACPDNYYVYEFVKPTSYYCGAYCADVDSINQTFTTVAPVITTTVSGVNMTQLSNCSESSCIQNILNLIENITVLPLADVKNLLDLVFNTSEKISISSSSDPKKLKSEGNQVLKAIEKLVSMLVKPTNTCDNVSFTLESVEAQVFMVGPQVTLNKIPRLDTTNASVDIDLIGIAKNNNETGSGSAAVAFMSLNTMENLLKAEFFNTSDNTSVKTMMSTVISATLPKTTNKQLTKPVNFTLKHIREFVSGGNMWCVYWNITEWIVDGCSVLDTNSSYTVCSCVHLSTFALIMQTSSRPSEDDHLMEVVNLVAVSVGLVFNSLALLTFAFCRWKPGVNNVARINLCISLLSAHLLFLLTQHFLKLIKPHQVLCKVLSGFLHFLFLSCFVWMFIEAVLLFICVKNLSQISSRQRAVLRSKFLIGIGYVISLVIVAVSFGLVPDGYGSDKCWIKAEKGYIWSFLGPVCVILVINTILFIGIIISLNSTLTKLNAEVSRMKQTKRMFFKTLAQFVVLGCPWILGFFTESSQVVKILFLILNSQQGTFIFLIYCLLNNEVRQQYVKWMSALFPGCKSKTTKDAPKKR